MEPLIPFMLFILYTGEGELELTRHPVIYENEQACQSAGTDILLSLHGTAGEPTFRCLPIPQEEEFAHLMQQIEADHAARREARDAERTQPAARPKP